MTSLRTFQTEIEEIHTRELTKQRVHTTTNGLDKEKKNKNPLPKGKGKADPADPDTGDITERAEMLEIEEKILVHSTFAFISTFH
jgi:hypothetical protein